MCGYVIDLDFSIMVYVVGLGLQIPELILFLFVCLFVCLVFFSIWLSVVEILNVKVGEINNFGNNFLLLSLFFPCPDANMVAKNDICIKMESGDDYGGDTWYMGGTFEELRDDDCIQVIGPIHWIKWFFSLF